MKVVVGENVYEANRKSVKSILKAAKKSAKTGAIYAIRKNDVVILLNDKSDSKEYLENGYRIFRK